ncbi:MAG: molecular chaperone HtpG, partial [Bacteroidetes bacterium]
MERGNISVSTENIFPIIKKSLYSEQEIFLRELVSNATDAIHKLKHLSSVGEFAGELGELKVTVSIDAEKGTLTVSDTGLGMTGEEVKKYLNQVAFSGAEEFLKKFTDAGSTSEIIGRFGLGFYSAFMVADEVEVITQSWQEGAQAVKWICDGTTTYSIEDTTREGRGTDVVLHLSEDCKDYLEDIRIRTILTKYCRFLPFPIFFGEEMVNNPNPIWKKNPTELSDEDYLELFHDLYPGAEDPLFWIHLNVDYPFNLIGVLFFPKIRRDIDPRRNQIQLYSRQVFITDEVSQIVPDYLMLLQGVIDSPDIPLNVSRSYLQGDPNVKKISSYITRKVADKLQEIFREDRSKFEEKWADISVFVKYGMMTDDKFYERAEKFCLIENTEHQLFTIAEFKEKISATQTDKDEQLVLLYTSDEKTQNLFVQASLDKGYQVLVMDGVLDPHFIGLLERKMEKNRWVRVDSDTPDKLIQKAESEDTAGIELSEEQNKRVQEAFQQALDERKGMIVTTQALGAEQLPVLITRPEFMRRMRDMAAVGGGGMDFFANQPEMLNLVVN